VAEYIMESVYVFRLTLLS